MGGIEINDKAEILNSEGKPFEGLYACGELAGGVHGANRLGGSSLLGCVVYGRVAGDSASNYLFQKTLQGGIGGAAQRLGQISLHIDPSQPGKISVEWGSQGARAGNQQAQQSQSSAAPVMSSKGDSSDPGKVSKPSKPSEFKVPEKEFTMEEVAKHNTKEDLWVVVKGVVMDVSDWLDEHPGGPQAIMNFMGRDATEEFEMLHDDEVSS
jgi:predicted heme/steroid binding protein